MKNTIYKKDIVKDLKKLGIRPGEKLAVHSSLKSLGWVYGGANTLIDALIEAVGTEGIIMMPSFTYSYELRKDAVPFNKNKTPAKTGHVSDTFWRRKNVKRSEHPTHSVAVFGKHAAKYVAGHNEYTPAFDKNSPLVRLAQNNGYILLIGVGHTSNSTIHSAEFLADLPFLDLPNRKSYGKNYLVERENGNVEKIPMNKKLTACSKGFDNIKKINGINEITKEGYVGNALCKLIKSKDMLDLIVPVLKVKPDFLFCSNPYCEGCRRREKRLAGISWPG